MYKVFKVEGGYEIFWCPSAPVHYADKVPYDGRIYPLRAAAYRKLSVLKKQEKARTEKPKEEAFV